MTWSLDPALRLPLMIAGGGALFGLLLLFLPERQRFRNGYRVVQSTGLSYVRRLLGLVLLCASVGSAVWRLVPGWRSHGAIPDVEEWVTASSGDGVLSFKLPPAEEGNEMVLPAGFQRGWISADRSVFFGTRFEAAGPGVGLPTADAVLASVKNSDAFQGLGLDLGSAKLIQQQGLTVPSGLGSRVGIDLDPGHRFFVQHYLVGGKLYRVVMYGPRRLFEEGLARTFFEGVSIRPSEASPAQPAGRLTTPGGSLNRPGTAAPAPRRHFEEKPGVKRVGE